MGLPWERFSLRRVLEAMTSILVCVWIEHGKSGCLCDLGHHRRLRSLDPCCRPKLQCARFMDLRCCHPHNDGAPERFRPHLNPSPFGAAFARPAAAPVKITFGEMRSSDGCGLPARPAASAAPMCGLTFVTSLYRPSGLAGLIPERSARSTL
jgi:hypothetical protein